MISEMALSSITRCQSSWSSQREPPCNGEADISAINTLALEVVMVLSRRASQDTGRCQAALAKLFGYGNQGSKLSSTDCSKRNYHRHARLRRRTKGHKRALHVDHGVEVVASHLSEIDAGTGAAFLTNGELLRAAWVPFAQVSCPRRNGSLGPASTSRARELSRRMPI